LGVRSEAIEVCDHQHINRNLPGDGASHREPPINRRFSDARHFVGREARLAFTHWARPDDPVPRQSFIRSE
jgi:hypothetical protein